MNNEVLITGIKNVPLPETRLLLYLKVIYNNEEFNWEIFCPEGVDFNSFLTEEEKQKIYLDIQTKLNIWDALDPKYEVIIDPFTGEEIQIPITKDAIVKPDMPDYYAKRRAEYPEIGHQLDAIWKGPESEDFVSMINKIAEIKNKYPKP